MTAAALRAQGLFVAGRLALTPADGFAPQLRSLWLLAPDGAGFWPVFTASPEYHDGAADPMDRWSARVITALAADLGGVAVFPFGRPHRPFFQWALRSGQSFASPVWMLVHDRMGLWTSFRGAIALPQTVEAAAVPSPCETCAGRPCLTACPVGALTAARYDLPACHAFLDTDAGEDCLSQGCAVRRACPAGQAYGRLAAQSAWHMRQFHP